MNSGGPAHDRRDDSAQGAAADRLPSGGSSPAPLERIHFSRPPAERLPSSADRASVVLLQFLILILLPLVLLHSVINTDSLVGWLGRLVLDCFILVGWLAGVGVSLGLKLRRRRRLRKLRADEQVLDAVPDESCRLRCAGTPTELRDVGPLHDVAFEPAVFNVTLAHPGRLGLLSFAVMGAAFSGGVAIQYAISGELCHGAVLFIYASIALGYVAELLLRPAYVRISPRCFELMRYTLFRRAPVQRKVFDLGRARLYVNLHWRTMLIEEGHEKLELQFALVWNPDRLAYMTFLAALSSRSMPELPVDQFAG